MGDMADYLYDQGMEMELSGELDCEPEIIDPIQVLHETDKARLVLYKNKQAWFPKSISHIEDNIVLIYECWYDPDWKTLHNKTGMKPIEGDFI